MTRPSLLFRPAGPADTDAVVALVESAYRGDESRTGWTTEAHLLDGQRTDSREVERLIADPDSVLLLAEDQGRVVACCHLRRESRSTAYFGLFAVRPAEQGAGFGHALLEEARRRASEWGCSTVRMTVIRQRDDLIAWYARRGFLPNGETAPFPYGDERFGRPLRPDLEFVVLDGPCSSSSRDRAGREGIRTASPGVGRRGGNPETE